MKAKIVDCRKMGLLERLPSFMINEYVTVWLLETGKRIKIKTCTKGGKWTRLPLERKLAKANRAKEEADELAKNIGLEITIGE